MAGWADQHAVPVLSPILPGVPPRLPQAAVWAREHALEVSKAAEEQLKAQQRYAAAGHKAAAAAAACLAQPGTQEGSASAAVVKQAAAKQQGVADGCGRGSAPPPLALQKLTHRCHRKAGELASAAGKETARQRLEADTRAALREQWARVQGRLPADAVQAATRLHAD